MERGGAIHSNTHTISTKPIAAIETTVRLFIEIPLSASNFIIVPIQNGAERTTTEKTAFGWREARDAPMARTIKPSLIPTCPRQHDSTTVIVMKMAIGTTANAAKLEYRGPKTRKYHGKAEKARVQTEPQRINFRLPSNTLTNKSHIETGNTTPTITKSEAFSANAADTPKAAQARAVTRCHAAG